MSEVSSTAASRWLRLVWASYMSGVALALMLGAWELAKETPKNNWVNVEFRNGKIVKDKVYGEIKWNSKIYPLEWQGQVIPKTVQIEFDSNDILHIRVDQLTRDDQRKILIKMILLAMAILLITWALTTYMLKNRFIVKI